MFLVDAQCCVTLVCGSLTLVCGSPTFSIDVGDVLGEKSKCRRNCEKLAKTRKVGEILKRRFYDESSKYLFFEGNQL